MKRPLDNFDEAPRPAAPPRPRYADIRAPFALMAGTTTDPCRDPQWPETIGTGDVFVTRNNLLGMILDFDPESASITAAFAAQPSDLHSRVETNVVSVPITEMMRLCTLDRANYPEARELQRLLLTFYGIPPVANESPTDTVERVRSTLTRSRPDKAQQWGWSPNDDAMDVSFSPSHHGPLRELGHMIRQGRKEEAVRLACHLFARDHPGIPHDACVHYGRDMFQMIMDAIEQGNTA